MTQKRQRVETGDRDSMNQPRPNSACSRPKTGLAPAPEQKKARKDVITDVYRILKKAKIFCIIRGVRRGLTRYKHTGANYLNAALADTFNSPRMTLHTPHKIFNSGNPPSLILTKDSGPAFQNPSSLARTSGYTYIQVTRCSAHERATTNPAHPAPPLLP